MHTPGTQPLTHSHFSISNLRLTVIDEWRRGLQEKSTHNTDDENTLKVVTWCQAGGVVDSMLKLEGDGGSDCRYCQFTNVCIKVR